MSGNVVNGASYLVDGAKMLTHPRLRPFVLIPLIINIVIFATLIGVAFSYVADWMARLLGWMPEWLSFLEWILWPLVALTASLFTGYLFTAVALLISSPFNALLAEKAEEVITGQEVDGLEGIGAALAEVPRAIGREIRKVLYYLPMALFVFALSWIITPLAPFLWFLLGAWMMGIQYLDYPMDNHRLNFNDVKDAVRQRRATSLGFGGLVALMTSIPVLNFFVVPSAVVGATLLWCHELRGRYRA